MNIVWLGQAGLLIKMYGKIILSDPYLSNSVEKINPLNRRKVPVDESFYNIKPDIIVLTHDHLDHTDPETLEKYLKPDSGITVLASKNAWNTARSFGGNNNYVLFNRHTQWTQYGIKFTSVKAEHSDDYAIGVIIEGNGKKLYITGDTLYNTEIFEDLPSGIDYVFLPINGAGNNMNMTDAERFCKKLNVAAIPLHCGLLDDIDMKQWKYENKTIPKIYKEIELLCEN